MVNRFILLCWFIIFSSCIDKFDFERPDSIRGAVSIQAKLAKGNPSTIEVVIKDVFDFFNSPRFLTAGKVLLIDEAGNELTLATKRQGFFNLEIPEDHPFFKVDYGLKYKIRIENLKGDDYESDFDELFPAPIPDNLHVEETTIEFLDREGNERTFDQLNFYIDTPLKAPQQTQNSRILWELVGIAKVTDTPNAGACTIRRDPAPKSCYAEYPPVKNYLTFDGINSSQDRIDNLLLNESNYTNLFAEGYYMVVYQQSVSEQAFTYWSRVGLIVDRTGDVFQEPVGKINTNVRNLDNPDQDVFGFFYATEQHPIRVYISPEFGRNPTNQCPLIGVGGEQADFCCNCLSLENSTDVKPDWWVE